MAKNNTAGAREQKKRPRESSLKTHFYLLVILAPVLIVLTILIGVFVGVSNFFFILLLVLTILFTVIGTVYCIQEHLSLRKLARLQTDDCYPTVFISDYTNMEFFRTDAESVREYAEIELLLYLSMYKKSGERDKQKARVISEDDRKALIAREKEIFKAIGRAVLYSEFDEADLLRLRGKTILISENLYEHYRRLNYDWTAAGQNGNTVVQLKNPKIKK